MIVLLVLFWIHDINYHWMLLAIKYVSYQTDCLRGNLMEVLSSKERFNNYLRGKKVDRLPAMPFIWTLASKVSGISAIDQRRSAENEAKCQIDSYRRFKQDSITIEYGLHGIGRALGSGLSNPENAVPSVMDPILKSLDNLDTLSLDDISITKDSYLQQHYRASEIILDEIGEEIILSIMIAGPFTAASSIFSPDKLLRTIRKDVENTHRLLDFCTDALIEVVETFSNLGQPLAFILCDPVASGTMLSRKQFEEFVEPYTKKLNQKIHSLGHLIFYHICGDSTPILKNMANTGVDFISVDHNVDLAVAKELIGDKNGLIGNVDPISVFLMASKEEIDSAVKECFEKASDSPKGFLVASGCDLPPEVPLENIEYFMEAAKKYGCVQ